MASKRKKDEPEKSESPKKALLARVRERTRIMIEADQENRRLAMDDLKFVNVPGSQWDANMKKERGDRPCYEFNRLRISCKRVINDMKANRSAVKVRGTEDSDKKKADIREGVIRNIWASSDADSIIDYQAEYQVGAGMGAWRVSTKYVSESSFDQDIVVEGFENPFCVYCDPAAKDPLKRDAEDWVVLDRISKTAYEAKYPKAEKINFESDAYEFDDEEEWMSDETVRIAEYWYKEPYDKELWQLKDGKVVDSTQPGANQIDPLTIARRRTVRCNRIKMCIASGEAILEEADAAGSMHRFVMVFGEYIVIDGKRHWCGLPRFSKDAQQAFNVANTSVIEKAASAPDAKFWATAAQANGNTNQWAEAHKKKYPFMLYNPDPKSPGPPTPMQSDPVPVALIQVAALAGEEIKATSGIFDASLGQEAPEKSGRAIIARQQQGEIATYNFPDNMKKAIQRTGEIMIDLVPKVYDTERQLRILGPDGAEDYVKVNQIVIDPATNKPVTINDLSEGRFDVTATTGPSFATKRQEASELYSQMAQSDPMLMPTAGDLVYKSMDLPYAEEIAERRRAMLPPQILQMLNEGKDLPPEAKAAMAQAVQAMQVVEQKNQLVAQAAQELQQEQSGIEKGKAEIQTAIANLKAQKAEFDAHVAQQMLKLTQAQVQLHVGEAGLQIKEANFRTGMAEQQSKAREDANAGERQQLGDQVAQALMQINEMAQQFAVAASQVLAQIQQAANKPKPKLKAMKARRVNGELIAEPVYDEAQTA
jgi:hypothetical protein